MSIQVALHHHTRYEYERPIRVDPQLVRLRPAYHARTPIISYGIEVSPDKHFRNWQQDPFGNPMARYVFPERISHLDITVDLIADMTVINPFDFFITDYADQFPFDYKPENLRQLSPYLGIEEDDPSLDEFVEKMPKRTDRLVDFLVEVNQITHRRVDYTVRLEPGVQTPEQTLRLGSGSCRDSAWLLTQVFRKLGLAARFVSGYLIQLTADIPSLDGPSGPTEDFCDLHAWTEVYVPGAGWVGLDPTSGLFAGEGHIPLTCTPHYADAAPITGTLESCEVEFSHDMRVTRHHETPRVTLPYDEPTWQRVLDLGEQVDERLSDGDVRLTMGGEPTFVSIDDMDDPQWTTDAVGPEKRVLSNVLLLRLREKFGPGGLLHYGQGKWYPGESLPRWALGCYWRTDGQPIWQNDELIADEGRDYGHTVEDARRFLAHLCDELGVDARMSFAVHEDTFHYLWRENQLPIDVDPKDPRLDDPHERAMMVRVFENSLVRPVGYVLPIMRAWWQAQPGWISGRWPTRGKHVFLIAGNSPIGLRLPLDTLPVSSAASAVFQSQPFDPSSTPDALPPPMRFRSANRPSRREIESTERVNEQRIDEVDEDAPPNSGDVIRTALCVECRHGRLYVFMPPTQRLEDYLDLVSAIETACEATGLPVVIEGYPPPPDWRLQSFKVTPDPGVIEVNMQPASSWKELVNITETMYEKARESRLGTDKFDLDGRHTGTGGGNHIVVGSSSTADSPFLRRPDLLASMVAFWNNHPSLSYLFSGKFIGPTSQAPRMDESRRDAADELRLAIAQVPVRDSGAPVWMVDRLFRDLLTDLTGNTHRAEICIDKLYSPDSSTGRLGLVELRGFEMPPHPRMSLVCGLLVRSIISAFWDRPYEDAIVDWGSSLHDRFLLSTFVREDLRNVLAELGQRGIEMDPKWFEPHVEFRFPTIGSAQFGDVNLQLRDAIEPWYVMGEEPGTGGTVRYVDSSLEKIELIVKSDVLDRHHIVCNGIRVPLHATQDPNEFVAGIRFRAWQPPRCLHPTIGVHSPLRFEVVDRTSGNSRGGCTYHVVHPGGRGTDQFPVNANEAESRRAARFEVSGMTGGVVRPQDPPLSVGGGYDHVTMDLRRVN